MRFGDLTYTEVRDLALGGALAVVPMGCIEQQGPHLPVDFDAWFAEALTLAAAERAWGSSQVVVLSALPFGPTPEHRNFGAGFIDLPRPLHDQILRAVLESLENQGFTRLIVWRGCGGHDLTDVVDRWNESGRRSRVWLPESPFEAMWHDLGLGHIPAGHADSFTTSIALATRPELVHLDRIPGPSGEPRWEDEQLDFTEYSASGVIGDARFASAELGQTLWNRAVEHLAQLYNAVSVTRLNG